MIAVLAEAPATPTRPMAVLEFDRITCGQCERMSAFLDDEDEGSEAAHDAGWHVYNQDDCDCPTLCANCAEDWCGARDNSPGLFGMRVA
ncbi:hypothetical protein [Streptomyces anulatus]|uniref:hypothetical protein n=1 Tax=Streptomyces anulatus TaxID=1892 RepID=UPI001C25EAA0|nr:hypothetical protein [Streptomyces anulatus]